MKITESSEKYRCELLNRLCTDCIYFIGYGDRHIKHLWAGNVADHIEAMRVIYDSLPNGKKPKWITLDQIKKYGEEMGGSKMEKTEWIATIETERGQVELGIQKNSKGLFEIIGKHEDGTIEKTEQTGETRELAIESIKLSYNGGLWFLEWIN